MNKEPWASDSDAPQWLQWVVVVVVVYPIVVANLSEVLARLLGLPVRYVGY